MKSLMLFYQEVLADAGTMCDISTTTDYKTVCSRVETEGLSFLTITLTDFGKDLEKGLDRGYVDHDLFKAFAFTSGLPRLFGGFLDLVFDRSSGVLLTDPSIMAIRALRQLTLMWGKMELQCTPERERAAFMDYVSCEQDVRAADRSFHLFEDDFKRISSMLFADAFSKVDKIVYDGGLVPKHGSGSTADGLRGNAKYYQSEWTDRLEEYFPAGEYLFPSWRHFDASSLTYLEPGAERPVKVITVPKTLKKPRIIAMEPTCMQYTQQALFEVITEEIESSYLLKSLIGYHDQTPNQRLARKGSFLGELATLDLSAASDRVSNQHVRALLANFPSFAGAVDSCRSRKADVPGFGVKRLAKFASMGSALCFPFEAMVFITAVFLGIERELKRHLTRGDIKSFLGKVRVFGDDIIVPVHFVPSVVMTLELLGFKVNRSKSFWTGKFRESCGKDYYAGEDVTLVRVKHGLPSQLTDVQELVSTTSLRNHLYLRGYWGSVRYLDRLIGDIIPFPAVGPDSPALGKISFLGYESQRVDPHLQLPMVKAAVVKEFIPVNSVDGYNALMKVFLKRGDEPLDKMHLRHSGRPNRARIKVGWTRAY